MHDTIYKMAVSTVATAITAMQGQTILNTDTLIPAGLWVGGLVIVWRASWRICEAVMKLLSRLEIMESRLTAVERECKLKHGQL
jgi:hypothetical protein